jgi:hypothetical protein
MNDTTAFAKMIPGFDFLQGLMKNASGAVPAMGQWIAPTLNAEELDKRVNELKAVKFWLEQNSRMLDATIQALEVQRMTLSTLQTMNLSMGDLQSAMAIKTPAASPTAAATATGPASGAAPKRTTRQAAPKASTQTTTNPAPGAVDPMQWWGALTKQFGELAHNAMQGGGTDLAHNIGALLTPSASSPATADSKSGRKTARPRKRAGA